MVPIAASSRSAISRLERSSRFDLTSDLGYRYPGAEDDEADQTLAELCASKMDERYPGTHHQRSHAHARTARRRSPSWRAAGRG